MTTSRQAATHSPNTLVQQLSDRRTQALVSRDVEVLHRVDVAASPAWRSDAAIIARLVRLGGSYGGLSITAGQAEVLQDAGSHATVRARVVTSAYTYQQNGTVPQPRAGSAATVELHLLWSQGRWRVASIG